MAHCDSGLGRFRWSGAPGSDKSLWRVAMTHCDSGLGGMGPLEVVNHCGGSQWPTVWWWPGWSSTIVRE